MVVLSEEWAPRQAVGEMVEGSMVERAAEAAVSEEAAEVRSAGR